MLIEYFVQNDVNETDQKRNPYPNIFILPKKYNSLQDVRVRDILESFPLSLNDNLHKYILRFETVIQIS